MRKNPFFEIYSLCNTGDPKTKLNNLPNLPIYIDVELTNYCNYKCLMCPVGTGIMKREQGFMSYVTYENILRNIEGKNIHLRFIRWGEPTLHKNYIDFIEMAKKIGIKIHLNTNGTLLDEFQMKKLIDINLDSIKFSFQGVDRKSYKEMRNNDYFDELIEKIKMLYRLRGNKEKPYIHVSTTITYETKEQVNSFKKLIEPFCDLVTVGRTILEHIDLDKITLNEKDKVTLIELKSKESVVKKYIDCCPEVYDKLSINWNGDVTACCSDYDNFMIIGNINTESIEKIWNSPKLNKIRQILADKEYYKLNLCKTCYDCMSIQTPGLQD